MKYITTLILLFIIAVGVPVFAADEEALLKELEQHQARLRSTWSGLLGKDIKERIQPAPDIIIDYLRKDNELNGYTERPEKAKVDPSFLADIHGAVDELPKVVRNHLEAHVVAVFLVEELGTTGYGELLKNFDENRLGFIVLDVDFLNRKANEWISWRENSPFTDKGVYAVEAEIELEGNNSRKAAIQYILLHELGHLVGVAKGAHPDWFAGGDPKHWPFTKLSWLAHESVFKGKSKYDSFFSNRDKLKFYTFQKAPLKSEAIDDIYRKLSRTDFVSLYAATNMYDDFAETYAMYVHVILQNKPWIIRVMRKGKAVREIREPILENRFIKKKEYMDELFKEKNIEPSRTPDPKAHNES